MNTESLSKKLTEIGKVVEVLCEDIQDTITKLTSDFRLVKNNYKSGPMLTYYTLMDMSRYCSTLVKKIETGADAYRTTGERIEGESKKNVRLQNKK